jgi:hypothetical protein
MIEEDRDMKMPAAPESRPTSLPVPPPTTKTNKTSSGIATGSRTSRVGERNGSQRHARPPGPVPPRHYARDTYKTTTVQNDSNPIWEEHDVSGGGLGPADASFPSHFFRVPLRKDDLFPSTKIDFATVRLEVRLDEEMSGAESILVGGALSTAVGAAAAGASVVGMGGLTRDASHAGMEMLGLGTDRLIGRGYVDLTPLLLGAWDEVWEQSGGKREPRDDDDDDDGVVGGRKQRQRPGGDAKKDDDDDDLNEYGRFRCGACRTRRRVERTGMMDVWVPLYHPNASRAGGRNKNDDDDMGAETSGMVHLLISYEPNGMSPKRDDIVAFESFARRPLDDQYNIRDDAASMSSSSSSSRATNAGPIINPVVPPLSPLLVIDARGRYLLLEYVTSRTVTSVDRGGNVKSSKWERAHRVRVHRNAVFVVERQTFVDGLVDVARLPGDIVLSTPLGREIAEVAAPVVAGVMELMGPAMLWGRLMVSAGGMGLRAGLAGVGAATDAVVSASQEKALERRTDECGVGVGGGYAVDAGVYKYIG